MFRSRCLVLLLGLTFSLAACSDDAATDPIDNGDAGGDLDGDTGGDARDADPDAEDTESDAPDADPDGGDTPDDAEDAADADDAADLGDAVDMGDMGDTPDTEDADVPDLPEIDCVNDQECPDGLVCEDDGDGQLCRPGCRGDRDCDLGTLCNRDGWICEPGCASNTDCPRDTYCGPDDDLGRDRCLDGCRLQPDSCRNGESCNADTRECESGPCQRDGDCAAEEYCDTSGRENVCVEGCRVDGCPQDQHCNTESRICEAGCVEDGDCPLGFYCDPFFFECLDGCRDNDECEQPQVCEDVFLDVGFRHRCVAPQCNFDEDCPESFYCGIDPDTRERTCLSGCRTDPDDCGDRSRCNARTRECETFQCVGDDDCDPGRLCADQRCEPGCRDNNACDGACVEGLCACQDTDDCAEGLVCGADGACVAPCASDGDCEDGLVCQPATQSCVEGCSRDNECGGFENGFRCDPLVRECGPIRCAMDQTCPVDWFCNLDDDPALCEEGCRPGQCGFEQYCDLDVRECVDGCLIDEHCAFGTFCDADANLCRVGCRDDLECGFGETCQDTVDENDEPTRRCLPPSCVADDDCDEFSFCGFDEQRDENLCMPGCRDNPDNCPEGSVCSADTRLCEIDACQEDGECDQGQICFDFGQEMICRIGCREDVDCERGEQCLGGTFRCSCQTNNDCADGQTCSIGECGPPCFGDSCGPGLFCNPDTQACSFTCEIDFECGGFELGLGCTDGECGPRACVRDQQCGPAQYCDGVCQEGCRVLGCGPESHCDTRTRECVDGCRNDDDCELGSYCDADVDTCLPGCRGDDECPGGAECREIVDDEDNIQRLCSPRLCNGDDDCSLDTRCLEDPNDDGAFVCIAACRTNPDTCGAHNTCDGGSGTCQTRGCGRDADCREGERCQDGAFGMFCGFGCARDAQCGDGQTCRDEVCSCSVPADCPGFQGCFEGQCQPGCLDDADCAAPQTCDVQNQVCDQGVAFCEEDEMEPNNRIDDAISLAPGTYNDLRICATFEPPAISGDCWELDVRQDERLEVLATFDHQALNLDLFLYTITRVEIAAATSRTDNESLDWTAPIDGLYVLCVIPADEGEITYDLRVTVR